MSEYPPGKKDTRTEVGDASYNALAEQLGKLDLTEVVRPQEATIHAFPTGKIVESAEVGQKTDESVVKTGKRKKSRGRERNTGTAEFNPDAFLDRIKKDYTRLVIGLIGTRAPESELEREKTLLATKLAAAEELFESYLKHKENPDSKDLEKTVATMHRLQIAMSGGNISQQIEGTIRALTKKEKKGPVQAINQVSTESQAAISPTPEYVGHHAMPEDEVVALASVGAAAVSDPNIEPAQESEITHEKKAHLDTIFKIGEYWDEFKHLFKHNNDVIPEHEFDKFTSLHHAQMYGDDAERKAAEAEMDAFMVEQREAAKAREAQTEPLEPAPAEELDERHVQMILADEDHTPKEKRSLLRSMVNKMLGKERVDKIVGKFDWYTSSNDYLIHRSIELNKEEENIKGAEKYFRSLGEAYNELGFKSKLAIGASLGVGAAVSMSFALPTALSLCVAGITAQRTAGLATMFLKFEKNAQDEKWGKEKAMAKAMLYTAGMTAGTMLAIKELKEGIDMARDTEWGKATQEWLGNMLGHPARHIEGVQMTEGKVGATATEAPQPAAAAAAGEAVTTPAKPEVPYVHAFASSRGYEDMAKHLWKQLHEQAAEKGLDPRAYADKFPEQSDIWKLLKADSHAINKVVHDIASDPQHGFFRADGSSVVIGSDAHMSINADGQIHIYGSENNTYDYVQAPGDAATTPAPHVEHVEAPAAPAVEVVPPVEVSHLEAQVAAETAPVVEAAPDQGVLRDSSGDVVHDSEGQPIHTGEVSEPTPPIKEAEGTAVQSAAPIEDHSFVVNKFNLTVPIAEPHLYADVGAKHVLAFGGTAQEKAQMISEFLKQNPERVVWSADANGANRIPWHLVNGEVQPELPVRTSGFFGFFSSFMKAPSPDEFKELIK